MLKLFLHLTESTDWLYKTVLLAQVQMPQFAHNQESVYAVRLNKPERKAPVTILSSRKAFILLEPVPK